MKKRILIIGLVAAFVAIALATPWLVDYVVKSSRSGPMHMFRLQDAPPFLTESLAISKAREALDLDGLNSNDWVLQEDDRSEAPDGTPDRFLVRNTIDSNRGQIMFDRNENGGRRVVIVELNGDVVSCQVWIPK